MTTLDSAEAEPLLSWWARTGRALARFASVLRVALAPILSEPVDRERRGRRYDLDETSAGQAPDPGSFRASGQGINFPAVFFFWTVAQLIGGVWWAATMQANVNSLTAENQKLWTALANESSARASEQKTADLQINHLENGLDERIRAKARETLIDWGYIHTPRKGE